MTGAGAEASSRPFPFDAAKPPVLLVTDRHAARRPLRDAVERALRGGAGAVLLREKDLATADLVALGREIAPLCRSAGVRFLVSHDVEAAVLLRADGVHLGFRSVGVARARAMAGAHPLAVGRSTHDLGEIRSAIAEGADYVTFGPVYDTASKRGILAPRGETALAEAVAAASPLPVLALGGVTAANAARVRRTGVAGIAVIGAILATDDETAAALALVAAWENAS